MKPVYNEFIHKNQNKKSTINKIYCGEKCNVSITTLNYFTIENCTYYIIYWSMQYFLGKGEGEQHLSSPIKPEYHTILQNLVIFM